jgi:hypothetical protein
VSDPSSYRAVLSHLTEQFLEHRKGIRRGDVFRVLTIVAFLVTARGLMRRARPKNAHRNSTSPHHWRSVVTLHGNIDVGQG